MLQSYYPQEVEVEVEEEVATTRNENRGQRIALARIDRNASLRSDNSERESDQGCYVQINKPAPCVLCCPLGISYAWDRGIYNVIVSECASTASSIY